MPGKIRMHELKIPRVYQQFRDNWTAHKQDLLGAYQACQRSFVPNLLPEQAIGFSAEETLAILYQRLGEKAEAALAHADPGVQASEVPASIRSPVAGRPDGHWLKHTNMVGIDVRTIGSFWNAVKYALTVPALHDSIHLLPIWEY